MSPGQAFPRALGIVIPTLNAARFLPATLLSIAELVDCGAKAVAVDGGSTDETLQICRDERIEVLHESQRGLYTALNAGFRHLATPWMTWINSDDMLLPSGMLSYLPAIEQADIHYGTVDYVDADGRFLHSWQSGKPSRLLGLYRSGCSPLLQQGTIFRREVFERLGGFDESLKYVADADFWWRAAEAGFRCRRLAHPTVACFRLHQGQLSQEHAKVMSEEHAQMVIHRTGRSRGCKFSLAALRYRLGNLGRYMVRGLRRKDVTGQFSLPRSYAVP